MSNPFGGIGAICVSKKPRTLHADVPTLTAHRSSFCHAELVSASVRGDVLEMARCEILKQVQDDICVLTAHYSQLITQNVLMSNLIAYRSPLTAHQRSIENSLQNRIFV